MFSRCRAEQSTRTAAPFSERVVNKLVRPARRIAAGMTIGKYKLARRIGAGGHAVVYEARDRVEGLTVALKIPSGMEDERDQLLREVRVHARLDHANILPIKNADIIDGQLVIASPLGTKSLADRLRYRLGVQAGHEIASQILAGLAHAHECGVMHCDLTPGNVILFADGRAMVSDFGLAKVALSSRTISGSGSGTVGYMAPEQAMGRPTFRSDVFAAGIVIYRMFAGELPRWPFRRPLPGIKRLRRKLRVEYVDFLLRAIEVDERRRFGNAVQMRRAFERMKNPLR